MIARTKAIVLEAAGAPRALYSALGAAIGLVVLAIALSPYATAFLPRMLLFYAGTALAYATMPYVRRGDIPLVAMWVVLGAELAPSIGGQLLSPTRVTADVTGIVLAALPIYIARLRQVKQGDTRQLSRRATDVFRI